MAQQNQLSPMMQKYMETKAEYPDCILFYRLGDFYEMFFEDAITSSRELELTLTGKMCGLEERAPMCGVPHHAVDTYLNRLVSKGYKVAICEQVEDVNDHNTELVTGRMSNNHLVHFPGDASMIGKIVKVHLDECKGFYYLGSVVE